MSANGLEEFREVVADFKSVNPYAIGGAVAAPLCDMVLKIGPSWPTGVPIITALAELLVLIVLFQFCLKTSRKRLNRRMIVTLALLCLSFVSYLILSESLTFVDPASKNRQAKGFILRPELIHPEHPVINSEYTVDQALKGAEYDPKEIWTPQSIMVVHLALLAFWLLMFVNLSAFIGSFVIYQRRRPATQQGSNPPAPAGG